MTTLTLITRYATREPQPEDTFADLGIDAIDRASLSMEIEDEMHITLHDEEVNACCTVGDMVRLVDGRVAA